MKNARVVNVILMIAIVALLLIFVIFVGVGNKNKAAKVKTVISSVKDIGELEVMTASVQINRQIFITKASDAQYGALYTIPGTAIYSVNLENLEIDEVSSSTERKKLLVGIPALEVKLMVHEDEIEKLDEYQKGKFTGSAKEGYEKYFLITKESVATVEVEISNSDGLMSMAEESAKKQIEALITSLSLEDCETILYFM